MAEIGKRLNACGDLDFELWALNFDLYDWLTLNFEYWTLTFMISWLWTLNIELWPLWLAGKRHVGTHGPCVRSNNSAYSFVIRLRGRTSRASLHRCLTPTALKGAWKRAVRTAIRCDYMQKTMACSAKNTIFAALQSINKTLGLWFVSMHFS